MRSFLAFSAGAVVALVAVVSMGAATVPSDYDRACASVQAENFYMGYLVNNKLEQPGGPRYEAAKKRMLYWFSRMEQFTP